MNKDKLENKNNNNEFLTIKNVAQTKRRKFN